MPRPDGPLGDLVSHRHTCAASNASAHLLEHPSALSFTARLVWRSADRCQAGISFPSIGDSHSPTGCASVCVQSPTPLTGCRDLRFLYGRGLWTIVLFVEPSFLPHRVCAPCRCQAAKDSVSAFSTALEPSNPKNKVRRAAAGDSRAYLQEIHRPRPASWDKF